MTKPGQNPARPLMLGGAAARGTLTFFFRITRANNGIAKNIVWVTNTSGQYLARRLTLRGAAAHGALTLVRLTREDVWDCLEYSLGHQHVILRQ